MKKNTFILAGNGPYENKGCEAITRGTVEILRENFDDPNFLVISNFKTEAQYEKQVREELDSSIVNKKTDRTLIQAKRYSLIWFKKQFLKFVNDMLIPKSIYKEMLPALKESKAVLSIGGDNYSFDYGRPTLFTDLDDFVLKNEKNIVIWGASIGPFSDNPEYEKYMSQHLKQIRAIFVRESATIEYLKNIGVTDNVYAVADPAFLMNPIKPLEDKLGFNIEQNSIGLNLSPLMARYILSKNMTDWEISAAKIIDNIADKFDETIYLIPHVVMPGSNDYEFMKTVFSNLKTQNRKRVIIIPPHFSAAEMKWIISQMKVFAGARTHSTIAAISTGVPTLSFAYSIKAKGINKDIFGHLGYCIEAVDLNPENVVTKLKLLVEDNNEIRSMLNKKLPEIKDKALSAGRILKEIINATD